MVGPEQPLTLAICIQDGCLHGKRLPLPAADIVLSASMQSMRQPSTLNVVWGLRSQFILLLLSLSLLLYVYVYYYIHISLYKLWYIQLLQSIMLGMSIFMFLLMADTIPSWLTGVLLWIWLDFGQQWEGHWHVRRQTWYLDIEKTWKTHEKPVLP